MLISSIGYAQSQDNFDAKLAWQEFYHVFNQDYAYKETSQIDTANLLLQYQKKALLAKSNSEFIDVVQIFLRHFQDPHLNIGPLNNDDYSVTPTGSDIWAVYKGGKYLVGDLKAGGAAYKAGIKVNSEVITVDGLSVEAAINKVFGGTIASLTKQQKLWGLNIALGGLRNQARTITIVQDNKLQMYKLAATYEAINRAGSEPTLSFKNMNEIGYIRFNNSLGNADTVSAFKEAIGQLIDTKALIIDLRNIPSGGNTSVAEPILGHFVQQETVYQLYQRQLNGIPFHKAELEKAVVKPSMPFYGKPFVVLAGRWTGSMGEGMMIGLDALGAHAVIGAPTADLLGGIKNVKLMKSGAVLDLGFERMFHVNGSYREDFQADIRISAADWGENDMDPALIKAINYLNSADVNLP